METYNISRLFQLLLYTSVFFFFYIFFLNQANGQPSILGTFSSDLEAHINLAKEMNSKSLKFSLRNFEPLFHLIVIFFAQIFKLISHRSSAANFANASALTLSLAKLALFIIVKKIIDENVTLNEGSKLFFTLVITFCSGLFLPFITPNIYLPGGSPNIFHNPTIILLTPLAFSFFYIYLKNYIINPINFDLLKKKNVFLSILLVLATLAKPSFTNIILVTIAISYLINPRKFTLKIFQCDLIIYLPSLILLVIQLFLISRYATFEGKLVIAPFKILKTYTTNGHYLVPLFQSLEFPLLITCLYFLEVKNHFDRYISYSWLFAIIAHILFIFFSFNGPAWSSGDLGWSRNLSLTFIYTFTIIEYAKILLNIDKIHFKLAFLNKPNVKKYLINITSINLSLIFLSGLYLFIKIFLGGSYS